ncbi:hypothetical protein LJR220_000345 [Bradyrhizobium sp. LjRoot220]|uniref:hypothetical protein n=1 Tax=Bradyrhizobium sp. LjRoot220 TaxID=3342284 RepID=UPI003ECFB078
MTKVNHELGINELELVNGGGLASAFSKPPTSTTIGSSGTGAPDWWNPSPGYLTMNVVMSLGSIRY